MTRRAVEALRHEVDAVIAMSERWTVEQWRAPSRAVGWSSKDVVCHLAAVFQQLCDPDGVPVEPSLGEQSVDLAVVARRHLLPHEVLEEYLVWSRRALDVLDAMQSPGTAEQMVPMSILGTYPAHLLANAYAFDHHCHVRHDLDLPSAALWPDHSDPGLLTGAAVDWIVAAIPQMCGEALATLPGPIDLHIDAATWRITCASGRTVDVRAVDASAPLGATSSEGVAASIVSTADAFVLWATQRVPAGDLGVEVTGDEAAARLVLERLKVF